MMEVVFEIKKRDLQRVKDILLKDETVSKASIVFKESSSLGIKGDDYYCYISGLEEACKKAKKLMKDVGEVVKKRESEEIISKIKSEEESAMSGFGSIFG